MTAFRALTLAALLTATGAAADPITGADAKALLYPEKGVSVELVPNDKISKDLMKVIKTVAEQQPWYAAVALSPDEDLMTSQATVAGAQFHDTDAAAAFALAGCEAKRTGESPCAVVALVRPKGWKARDLQLSLSATAYFNADYLAAPAPKAMATSASTGSFGFGAGADAALADCVTKSATDDCVVVIAD
jgi:hypothetical protein